MDPDYEISADGTFQYTQEGKERYRNMFADHDLDLNKINTWTVHREAIEYCAVEAINALAHTQISSLDKNNLLAVMRASDNGQAKALIREKEVLERRSQIRLV